MKWLTNNEVENFINSHNYDIRVLGNARWIDQKCTPDVLTIISDCILSLVDEKEEGYQFNSSEVWHNEYTESNVSEIFKKPNPNLASAKNEYDKFFSQPLELLAYSGVLKKTKRGNKNFYSVAEYDILRFISLREMNSLNFLYYYCEKVLRDSGLYDVFNDFFENPSKNTYNTLKNTFVNFCIDNTPINKPTEPRRIFTKIINPLAFKKSKPGSEGGYFSKDVITYDMLMYNRDNFRDMHSAKPKNVTRKDYGETRTENRYFNYLIVRAKKYVKLYNDENNFGHSEIYDDNHQYDVASHMHHIFPKEDFPSISAYHENLIALTPTQHLNYAHVNGNTRTISRDYQYICLISKTGTIKQSYELQLGFYEFYKFMEVLSVGLDNDIYLDIETLNFNEVLKQINLEYNRL